MFTVLRERASTGIPLGGGVVLLVAALVVTWSLGPLPDGADAANAANVALTSVLFLGPLTAGVAAAQAGRDLRGQLHDLARSTRRGVLGSGLVVVGASSGWAVLAYAGILLAAFLRGENGMVRWSDLSLVLAALSLILLCAVGGAEVGSRWNSTRSALVVAVLTFAVLYGGGYLEIWSARWATVYPGTAYPLYLEPNVGLNVGKSMLALSLCLVLASAAVRSGRRLWQGAGLVGLFAGIALIVTAPDWPAVESHTDQPVCQTSSGFTICAWPQHSDRIPGISAALQRLDRLVGDVYTLPSTYRQIGAGQAESGEGRLGSLGVPGRSETEERVLADLAVRSLPSGDCPDEAAEAARDRLSAWLQSTTQGLTPVGGEVAREDVARWAEQVQRCRR